MALDNFIIVKGDDSGNVTLQLSKYAAWALLRRLQGVNGDDTEQSFINEVVERLNDALD